VGRCRGAVAGTGGQEGGAGEPDGDPGPAERRCLPGHHPRSRGQGLSRDHTTDPGAAVVRPARRRTGGHRPRRVRAAGARRHEAAGGPGRGTVRGGGGELRQRRAGQVGPVRAGGAGRGETGRAHPAAHRMCCPGWPPPWPAGWPLPWPAISPAAPRRRRRWVRAGPGRRDARPAAQVPPLLPAHSQLCHPFTCCSPGFRANGRTTVALPPLRWRPATAWREMEP
jgi:hypothetical protein